MDSSNDIQSMLNLSDFSRSFSVKEGLHMSKVRHQMQKSPLNTNSYIVPFDIVLEQGFSKGINITLAYRDILESQSKLSYMLTRVADAIALTEGVINRGDRLRAWFTNLDSENEIRNGLWALRDANTDFTNQYSASTIPLVIHEIQKQLIQIADDFREGIRTLTSEKEMKVKN
jgi:hypothetical protein